MVPIKYVWRVDAYMLVPWYKPLPDVRHEFMDLYGINKVRVDVYMLVPWSILYVVSSEINLFGIFASEGEVLLHYMYLFSLLCYVKIWNSIWEWLIKVKIMGKFVKFGGN